MSEFCVGRREYWAYVRQDDGTPLPSTIRERAGDCDAALKKTDNAYRNVAVKLARVIVEFQPPTDVSETKPTHDA